MNRIIYIFILYILCLTKAYAQYYITQSADNAGRLPLPKHEVRAVWLTTIGGLDWPRSYSQSPLSARRQQNELCQLLDTLQRAGINTVLFQTRIRGTVVYPSRYEPWDACLSGFAGRSPGYDALQFAIEECHKRGMELHAWIVCIPVGKWQAAGCQNLRKRYPQLVKKIDADGYMSPENPLTAKHIADVCEEIAENYDIDGIHLDYIRYPEAWKQPIDRRRGRQHITNIVQTVHQRVKKHKRWVKISSSPIGKYKDLSRYNSRGWNAYHTGCQDAQGWLRDGIMDCLFPMMYFRGNNFYPFALDWAENSYGRTVVPGLGIYFLSPREGNWTLPDITREMEFLRRQGLGHCYFRARFFIDDTKGIRRFATEKFDIAPALIPPMTWEHSLPPTPPTLMETVNGQLRWYGAHDNSNAPYLLYNVYGSKTHPVDTRDARNLLVARTTESHIALPETAEEYYYAVTSLDRYGNESTPVQSHSARPKSPDAPLIYCDGNTLILPSDTEKHPDNLITINTLQGTTVASRRATTATIHVKDVPDGFYEVALITPKGRKKHIGYALLKRE